MSNTRGSVSSGYPNTEKRVENSTHSGVFLTKFWIADKTLSRVFDISSQSNQNLRSKRRNKIVKNICWLRPGIETSFTVMIFFVFTWLIINEFEKHCMKHVVLAPLVLRWRLVLPPFFSPRSSIEKKYEKIEGCKQSMKRTAHPLLLSDRLIHCHTSCRQVLRFRAN